MHILRGIRMMMVRLITRATCHCEMRATCFSEGGVPTLPPFLTCLFCPKNGRVKKNNWLFLKTEEVSSSDWATWRVGVREPKRPL